MADSNKKIILVLIVLLLFGCNRNQRDKYYTYSILTMGYHDVNIKDSNSLVQQSGLNWNDTNKYVLINFQMYNKYFFSSKEQMTKWHPESGYRGPSDSIISLTVQGSNTMFVKISDSIMSRKMMKANGMIGSVSFYDIDQFIETYNQSHKQNANVNIKGNWAILAYKDSLRKYAKTNTILKLVTSKKIISKHLRRNTMGSIGEP